MADNAQPGGTGDTYRTKDRAGVETQIVGLDVGIGTGTEALMSSANPMPVNLSASGGNVAVISGTLSVAAAASLTGTTSTTGAIVAPVGTSGNGTFVLGSGTYTALTLAFEASLDGTLWFPIDGTRTDGSQVDLTPAFSVAGVRAWNYIAPGYQYVRVRASAITQTVAPTIYITQGPFLYDPSPTAPPVDGNKTTYVASVTGMSTTIASDIFRLAGSATRTVRVTAVEVACTTGAATNSRIQLIKRTTADTGGTTSAATVGAYDSTDVAATATATGYTVAPTLGTAGPTVGNGPAFTAAAGSFSYSKTWGARPSKALVLRGTGESLCVNNAVAIGTSGSWTITVEWTEE